MTKTLLFTEEEWNVAMPQVVHAMTEHLRPYRTAVYEHKRDDEGEFGVGCGSGSFISLDERVFILTNEHVAVGRNKGRILAYQFDGQEDIRRVLGDQVQHPSPLDLAVMPVDGDAWERTTHQSKAITTDQIALAHDPVIGELLTFTGFAGETVSFHYGALMAQGTCSTAREIELPEDDRFSSRFHFGIDYRPDLATNVIDRKGLPKPP